MHDHGGSCGRSVGRHSAAKTGEAIVCTGHHLSAQNYREALGRPAAGMLAGKAAPGSERADQWHFAALVLLEAENAREWTSGHLVLADAEKLRQVRREGNDPKHLIHCPFVPVTACLGFSAPAENGRKPGPCRCAHGPVLER